MPKEPPETSPEVSGSFQLITATMKTAMAGASHCHAGMAERDVRVSSLVTKAASVAVAAPKIRALRSADGGRGFQERNRLSV